MNIKPPAGMTFCTKCGGDGNTGQDEEGRYYTCYRCCETGWITQASADEELLGQAQYEAEQAAKVAAERKELGVPDGWGYYYDEWSGEMVFTPPRGAKPEPCLAYLSDEEIPF